MSDKPPMPLRDRIARYLMSVPAAIEGQNGSAQTFYVALKLVHGFALSESEALEYLRMYSERCQPPWSEKELVHKVSSAAKAAYDKPRGHLIGGNGHFDKRDIVAPPPVQEPKPKIDPATTIENWLKGFRADEQSLYERTPIKPSEDWTQDGILLVSSLFEAGEKVNFVTKYQVSTRKSDGAVRANPNGLGESVERDDLISRWSIQGMPISEAGGWMRMNPVDGEGVNDANITAFRFALLEWDGIPLELQLSFLARVPLPISAILTSGGKSVHAWIRVDASAREEYETTVSQLRDTLVNFGMDRKNKNPSRLSRLVGVKRVIGADGDGRQRLLYLNPLPEQRAIL